MTTCCDTVVDHDPAEGSERVSTLRVQGMCAASALPYEPCSADMGVNHAANSVRLGILRGASSGSTTTRTERPSATREIEWTSLVASG